MAVMVVVEVIIEMNRKGFGVWFITKAVCGRVLKGIVEIAAELLLVSCLN